MYDLPNPRYILVHSFGASIDANNLDSRGHCFGPFKDYDAVVAFDKAMPRDSCSRFVLPLIGPKQRDVAIMLMGMRAGCRAGALELPPREDPAETPMTRLITEALNELFGS
jgi:hypothetical protein